MASLLRFVKQGCQVAKANPALVRKLLQPSCFISTSKKKTDAATGVSDIPIDNLPKRPMTSAEEVAGPITAGGKPDKDETVTGLWEKEENWISFGYDLVDRDLDEWEHHAVLFAGITCFVVGSIFFFMYCPDAGKKRKWAMREGYLELERRRAEGLPLVDPNLIPASRIELPSEEELGGKEIII